MNLPFLIVSIIICLITPENAGSMSEMFAIYETKYLICWVGNAMIEIHKNLLLDVFNKNTTGYVLTDSYDLVHKWLCYFAIILEKS